MKKYLLLMAAICGAMIYTSCSQKEEPINIPQEISTFSLPEFANKAAMLTIALDKIVADGASLTAINFTESGKAILELTTGSGVLYATYNATVTSDGTLIVTDEAGNEVGRITNAISRSSEDVNISVSLNATFGGKTYQFNTASPVAVQRVMNTLVGYNTVKTNNVARTWQVASMNIVIEGGVEVSMIERSGNLKVFADAAQEAGAKLTQDEYLAFCKVIKGVTLDKNGMFSIQYTDNNSEACTWKWTDINQKELLLELRKSPYFGNKFMPLNSKITVDFAKSNIVLSLRTDITGEKNYQVLLTFVLK